MVSAWFWVTCRFVDQECEEHIIIIIATVTMMSAMCTRSKDLGPMHVEVIYSEKLAASL